MYHYILLCVMREKARKPDTSPHLKDFDKVCVAAGPERQQKCKADECASLDAVRQALVQEAGELPGDASCESSGEDLPTESKEVDGGRTPQFLRRTWLNNVGPEFLTVVLYALDSDAENEVRCVVVPAPTPFFGGLLMGCHAYNQETSMLKPLPVSFAAAFGLPGDKLSARHIAALSWAAIKKYLKLKSKSSTAATDL